MTNAEQYIYDNQNRILDECIPDSTVDFIKEAFEVGFEKGYYYCHDNEYKKRLELEVFGEMHSKGISND